jgi:hypothetical protein
MDRSLVSLSKLVSLVLRHEPQRIGLTLDPHGWAKVDDLLAAAAAHGTSSCGPTAKRPAPFAAVLPQQLNSCPRASIVLVEWQRQHRRGLYERTHPLP